MRRGRCVGSDGWVSIQIMLARYFWWVFIVSSVTDVNVSLHNLEYFLGHIFVLHNCISDNCVPEYYVNVMFVCGFVNLKRSIVKVCTKWQHKVNAKTCNITLVNCHLSI